MKEARLEQQVIDAIHVTTPPDFAKALNIVQRHIQFCNPCYQEPNSNRTMLHYACLHGNEQLANSLLNSMAPKKWNIPDDYGHTPLHLACQYGRLNIVNLLLNRLSDPTESSTPSAAASRSYYAFSSQPGFSSKTVADLIPPSSPLNSSESNFGSDPLLAPSSTCDLLGYYEGPSIPNSPPVNPDSPSIQTASSSVCPPIKPPYCGPPSSIPLLKHSLEMPDLFGSTPFHVACQHGQLAVVKELLNRYFADPVMQEILMRADIDGRSPLFAACERGHAQVVSLLLLAHPNPAKIANQHDRYGITPLLATCQQGRIETIMALIEEPNLDVNMPSMAGETPLMASCHAPNGLKVARCLMASEGKLDSQATMREHNRRVTALDLALDAERNDIIQLIMAYNRNRLAVKIECQIKLGLMRKHIAELFGIIVLLSDQFLSVPSINIPNLNKISLTFTNLNTLTPFNNANFSAYNNNTNNTNNNNNLANHVHSLNYHKNNLVLINQIRFFNIAKRLPPDLQMVLCNRWGDCCRDVVSVKDADWALRKLAIRIWKRDQLELNSGRFKMVRRLWDWLTNLGFSGFSVPFLG